MSGVESSGPSAAATVTGPDAFGAAAVVGTSGRFARQDHDHGLPANPAPNPATSVTGPDAFGAPAVVGTSTNYARQDHDHGLPSAPSTSLTNAAGHISSDVTLTAATVITVFTTASLAIGTWLVSMSLLCIGSGATAGQVEAEMDVGSATATFDGTRSMQGAFSNAATHDPSDTMAVAIVTVTVAGTLILKARASVAALAKATTEINQNYPNATGYTAVKIA